MTTSPNPAPSARRRRALRALIGAATVTVVAGALAIGGAGAESASAAQGGGWGSFTLTGSGGAYTGTMTLPGGFPQATFTSSASGATMPAGGSTWQAATTPPGAQYGSSRTSPYLNLRPAANTPTPAGASVTTYTFAAPTPTAGWSFVLGDIDADQATVSATDATGAAVPPSVLGFQGVYNYCHQTGGPSCDADDLNDVPTYDAATGTLVGNGTASDTDGATGWFSPTVALSTLTITYQQRSGFPVYQTWFGTTTFAASGSATLDGAGFAGATVTVTDPSGRAVATTTTDGSGAYSVPALTAAPGYRVTVTPPAGSPDPTPLAFDLTAGDATRLDFAFTSAVVPPTPVDVIGQVVTPEGTPVADTTVSVLPAEGAGDTPIATTVTDGTGAFVLPDLEPETDYRLVIDGDTTGPRPITTGTDTTDVGALVLVPAPVTPPVDPPVTPPVGPPVTPPTTAPVVPAGQVPVASAGRLAYTGSEPVVPLGVGAALVLVGLVAVGGGLIARRRR
ncbi:carboxypeptidase regulatory-like domain-containing protein [Frigoribacterium sp. 2-23]|uniref:carboxypeptidase regulatory-like domain-containing protein n=1 Tax=Frigoribacterium sp. 2-23 TaxID=3415006 RepID=UPI003C6FC2EC